MTMRMRSGSWSAGQAADRGRRDQQPRAAGAGRVDVDDVAFDLGDAEARRHDRRGHMIAAQLGDREPGGGDRRQHQRGDAAPAAAAAPGDRDSADAQQRRQRRPPARAAARSSGRDRSPRRGRTRPGPRGTRRSSWAWASAMRATHRARATLGSRRKRVLRRPRPATVVLRPGRAMPDPAAPRRHPYRPLAHRDDAHRHSPHGAFQLAVCTPYGRQVPDPDRGHRSRALDARGGRRRSSTAWRWLGLEPDDDADLPARPRRAPSRGGAWSCWSAAAPTATT